MNINQVALKMNGNLSYGNVPQYIILHHADMNGTVEQVNATHLQLKFVMIGYNYYVRKNGNIYKGRPENAIGGNCYGYNSKSISICAEGNFMVDKMSDAQKSSIIWLGQYVQNEYNHKLKVVGHKQLLATACPGTNYPLTEVINGINSKVTPSVKTIVASNVSKQVVTKTGIVTASSLNVRASASTTAKIIGTLPKGSKVIINRTEGNWYVIHYEKNNFHGGFVSSEFIKLN